MIGRLNFPVILSGGICRCGPGLGACHAPFPIPEGSRASCLSWGAQRPARLAPLCQQESLMYLVCKKGGFLIKPVTCLIKLLQLGDTDKCQIGEPFPVSWGQKQQFWCTVLLQRSCNIGGVTRLQSRNTSEREYLISVMYTAAFYLMCCVGRAHRSAPGNRHCHQTCPLLPSLLNHDRHVFEHRVSQICDGS